MDCQPTRPRCGITETAWVIEPTFATLKVGDSTWKILSSKHRPVGSLAPDHDAGEVLVCGVSAGTTPSTTLRPLKKSPAQTDPHHGSVQKVWRSLLSGFKRGLRLLQRRLQTDQPLRLSAVRS